MNSSSTHARAFSSIDIPCVLGVLACSLIGFAPIAKYFRGIRSLFVFIAIVVCILVAMAWLRWRHLHTRRRLAVLWMALPWCLFTLCFALLYPLAQRHAFGAGSDRADALRIAATALMHGHYPYYSTTFLGNDITPLPGAILLAAPFVLLGSASLQNIFWLAIFLWFTRGFFRSRSTAIVYVLVLLGSSAANLDDFMVGGDYIVNAMYVCIAVAVVAATHRKNAALWLQIASEVFLGLAVDSRPVYLVALPPLFAYLWQRRDRKAAIRAVVVTGFVAAMLSLPFYLYDPTHFAPLHIWDKLYFIPQQYHAAFVFAALGLLASCIGFAMKLSRRRVFLLMGIALFLMLGLPGLFGWFLFPFTLDGWFQLSLASPSALFLSLWLFAIYEKTGYSLRASNENSEGLVDPAIGIIDR